MTLKRSQTSQTTSKEFSSFKNVLPASPNKTSSAQTHKYPTKLLPIFFCPSPLPFGGSTVLRPYSRTSRESNHHRQSVSALKNDALPTEPRGHPLTKYKTPTQYSHNIPFLGHGSNNIQKHHKPQKQTKIHLQALPCTNWFHLVPNWFLVVKPVMCTHQNDFPRYGRTQVSAQSTINMVSSWNYHQVQLHVQTSNHKTITHEHNCRNFLPVHNSCQPLQIQNPCN